MNDLQTDLNEARIRAMIDQAESKSRLNKRDLTYKADWLVSGEIGSDRWAVSFPNINEPTFIDFNRLMPDGSNLTDESNQRLLTTLQKWLYHCRMGTLTGKLVAPGRWMNYLQFSFNLASWIKLHRFIYKPEANGFMLLDTDACEAIADELSTGGWNSALLLKERFITHLFQVIETQCTLEAVLDNLDELDEQFKSSAIRYFQDNNLYVGIAQDSNYTKGMLSREYIAEVLGKAPTALHAPSFRLFIRQFEPKLTNADVLQVGTRKNLHYTQNTKSIEEAADTSLSVKHFKDQLYFMKLFFNGHSKLPDDIPKIDIDIESLVKEYATNLKSPGHTNLIPLTIGLDALNEAAKWVTVYGEAVVNSLIFYIEKFREIDENYSLSKQSVKKQELFEETKHLWMTKDIEGLPAQRLDKALNITKLQTKKKKNFPTGETHYKAVMESFFGACALVIGMLKPIRNKEISHLDRACLWLDNPGGGAFLEHEAGKAGQIGINPDIIRPIPSLTARAIQLLQVLGVGLSKIYNDERPHAEKLFYIPGRGFKLPPPKCNMWKVNLCLNSFCEIINTPIDKKGRRWYIRVHEMRKFFLLITHRHYGDGSKGLLRYLAGHADRRNIDDYTAYDISDAEAIRYESECIDDKLIALELGILTKEGNDGLVALHAEALKHFDATSISTISKSEFMKYLDKVGYRSDFDMKTYSIRLENYDTDVYAIDFAIKLGERKDEKYDK